MAKIELSLWISRKDVTFFTKNFSVMLGAGLTVVEALTVSEEQSGSRLRKVLKHIHQYVEQGNSLADGFKRYHRQFSPVFVDVIRNGELSGNLARNMRQLANQLADDLDLRRKIRSAMIYPMIIVVGLVVLGSVLSLFVLPRFTRLFSSLDIPLPLMTQYTLLIAGWMSHYWWGLLIGLAITTVLLRLLLMIHAIKTIWHAVWLRLPVMRGITQSVNLARFAGTLGSLLSSGVPIAESLHSVVHASNNVVYQNAIRTALRSVEQGNTLSGVLANYPVLFPALVVRMVAVGERTGQLADILLYIGKYYEGEVDTATKQLGVLIEPVLLILIGLAVLGVGLAVITPIYEFTASVGAL